MFRRIASICLVVLSLLLLAFSSLQLGYAHASVLAAVATSTRTRTRTPTRTATSSRTPTKSPTPASVVTGSVSIQNTTAAYGEVGHVTATFTAQSTAAQVTQMRTAATWGSICIDVTMYASWGALITSQISIFLLPYSIRMHWETCLQSTVTRWWFRVRQRQPRQRPQRLFQPSSGPPRI